MNFNEFVNEVKDNIKLFFGKDKEKFTLPVSSASI